MKKIKFAPRKTFEQILKWAVIPTFDLVVECGNGDVIILKRKIPPYQNQWALPGLRMFKGESINDTLKRIAKNELGLNINPSKKTFLGQYVGKFKTEHSRQDLSTGYCIKVSKNQKVSINHEHFSSVRFINSKSEIPTKIGAMYKYYLNNYFKNEKLYK